MSTDNAIETQHILTALRALRRHRPRVHCITNNVAMNLSANALLALGAQPSMSLAHDEIGDFVASADALLVNLGTLDAARCTAIEHALDSAARHARPWVLDPVLIDRAPSRLAFAVTLMQRQPTLVRGNCSEIEALCRQCALNDPLQLAVQHGSIILASAAQDRLYTAQQCWCIDNGHPLMSQVTAIGCAASALLAASIGCGVPPALAALTATLTLNIAGEKAARRCHGPGSFTAAWLDALAHLDPIDLMRHALWQETSHADL